MSKTTTKRETQSEKIKRIFDKSLKEACSSSINDCTFVGVQFDAKAVDAITMIAEGLQTNAKALGDLAAVLKAGNVHLDTMLRVDA